MFYTHTITEDRLKAIKKIFADRDRLVGANGGCLLSDGTYGNAASGYEIDILFNMEPKKLSKRVLVAECIELVKKSHIWDSRIPEQERLEGERSLNQVYAALYIDKDNVGAFIPENGDSEIWFEIRAQKEDSTTVVFNKNECLNLYRRPNGKKYYDTYGMTSAVFTFVEKWLRSKGYESIGFERN